MTKPDFKRYLKLLFGAFIFACGILIALNWWIDPLQFYRRATYPPFLIGEKRFQAPGLVKNYPYDTLVVGTSVSENFEAKTIKEKLGLDALNVSMQGASAREQSLVLTLALKTGKVRRVIWDINYEYLRGDPQWVANYDGNFPFYFYDANPLDKINNYLLNVDTAKSSLKILLQRCGWHTYHSQTPDELYPWYRLKKSGVENVAKAWRRAGPDGRHVLRGAVADYWLTNLNANFDLHVLQPIREHPEVRFDMYFPPFSIGYYAAVHAGLPEIYEHMLQNKQYIFAQTRNLPNVQLFDFQPLPDIVYDPENYFDLVHFNHHVGDYILDSLRLEHHLMTSNSIVELQTMTTNAAAAQWVKQFTP